MQGSTMWRSPGHFLLTAQYLLHSTYHHERLGQYEYNDYFIVSKTLLLKGQFKNYTMLSVGDITSDHLPILM